jgi:hypothetical protein
MKVGTQRTFQIANVQRFDTGNGFEFNNHVMILDGSDAELMAKWEKTWAGLPPEYRDSITEVAVRTFQGRNLGVRGLTGLEGRQIGADPASMVRRAEVDEENRLAAAKNPLSNDDAAAKHREFLIQQQQTQNPEGAKNDPLGVTTDPNPKPTIQVGATIDRSSRQGPEGDPPRDLDKDRGPDFYESDDAGDTAQGERAATAATDQREGYASQQPPLGQVGSGVGGNAIGEDPNPNTNKLAESSTRQDPGQTAPFVDGRVIPRTAGEAQGAAGPKPQLKVTLPKGK